MSCITPVPLGWACPPASFASKLSSMSLASPSHHSLHKWRRDVSGKRYDGSLASEDCSTSAARVSAACLDGNLMRTIDLAPLTGTSSLHLSDCLRANVRLHSRLSGLDVLSLPLGEGVRSVFLGANNFIQGWMRGQVLLRNGPHASQNRHAACASVI